MSEVAHLINNTPLTVDQAYTLVHQRTRLTLSDDARTRIRACRTYLDQKIESTEHPIYGINTGFGSLCDTEIGSSDLEKLQENLVRSHAAGMGNEVPVEIVRLMLFLKIQGLSLGYSGVHEETVDRLIDLYNHDVLPLVYESGSLGASGDLAPLAHLSLPLLGEGKVRYQGEVRPAGEVLASLGWEPIRLRSKEGLALLNGTQFMSAFGVFLVAQAKRMLRVANHVAALSLDAFDGRIEPFLDLPHQVRKQPGQLVVARAIRSALEGSELMQRTKRHVQDPYSFRCIPQVHGAVHDALAYVEGVMENEINSVTDNPTVFPDDDAIYSAGNFHGEPLALALDHLAVLLTEISSISERRTYKLISGQRGLPAFLLAEPGLHSGFMIPQYTAASIVSKNKQMSMPASVDTIDSSNGQEDHVSMGANAAVKAHAVFQQTEQVLAVEWLNASQALEFRRPGKTSPALEQWVRRFRDVVPFVSADTIMHNPMQEALTFLQSVEV